MAAEVKVNELSILFGGEHNSPVPYLLVDGTLFPRHIFHLNKDEFKKALETEGSYQDIFVPRCYPSTCGDPNEDVFSSGIKVSHNQMISTSPGSELRGAGDKVIHTNPRQTAIVKIIKFEIPKEAQEELELPETISFYYSNGLEVLETIESFK